MSSETSESKPGLVDVDELRQKLESQKPDSYRWNHENGRRYASRDLGGYFLPNDDPEIERLNEQHWIFTQAKDGMIFNAPIDPKQSGFRILDIGCGSGIWCMQMADAFPNCSIVGMDISPIQPKEKPPNVEWVVQNAEAEWPFSAETTEWPFSKDHFDFIRLSLLNGSFADFGAVMQTIMKHLKPGGFVEHQEYSIGRIRMVNNAGHPISESSDVNELPPLPRWARLMELAAEKRGRSLKLAPDLKSYQTSAGLHEVKEKVYPLPIGTWPQNKRDKLIGSHMMLQGIQGMEGLSTVMFTKALQWSLEDTNNFLEKVKQDIRNDDLHKFMDLHLVYGRKVVKEHGSHVLEQGKHVLEKVKGAVDKYNAENWIG